MFPKWRKENHGQGLSYHNLDNSLILLRRLWVHVTRARRREVVRLLWVGITAPHHQPVARGVIGVDVPRVGKMPQLKMVTQLDVPTPRMGFGANRELRVKNESILIFQRTGWSGYVR